MESATAVSEANSSKPASSTGGGGGTTTGVTNCAGCDKSLAGHRYVLRNEQPYCLTCYESQFANTCQICQAKIGCDSKELTFKQSHWHETCFRCSACDTLLGTKPFATRDSALFCSECYDEHFALRCTACTQVFKAGMKKFEYRGDQWHEECFLCVECNKPIGSGSFIPLPGSGAAAANGGGAGGEVGEQQQQQDEADSKSSQPQQPAQLVCVPCYEAKHAQRCSGCDQVIRKGGVTYKGAPWHRECFVCAGGCGAQLAGSKFTSKDDRPYCATCYGEKFARKCVQCSKPITGFGGCKFVSFEERSWHSECFVCAKCGTSLVGLGFLTRDQDVMCAECGR